MSVCLDDQIPIQLARFRRHHLEDLNQAQLMNRVDQKYLMPRQQLTVLLDLLESHCSVLEVDANLISKYENTYFDTEQLDLYHHHHNGKRNRLKVRTRRYAHQGLMFLEAKLKTNKDRTFKHRTAISQYDPQVLSELAEQHRLSLPGKVSPIQDCDYRRISFAREQDAERLTLDFDLQFDDLGLDQKVHIPNLVIVELKQGRFSASSQFASLLKSLKLTPTNFSKYCIGVALLRRGLIKTNRFKPTLLQLQKAAGDLVYV